MKNAVQRFGTVSYTHLDVYKRQGKAVRARREISYGSLALPIHQSNSKKWRRASYCSEFSLAA